VDEVHIKIMSVYFGGGQRLFENIADEKIKLEKIKIIESVNSGTEIKLRVKRVSEAIIVLIEDDI